jgi:hypothetical protein
MKGELRSPEKKWFIMHEIGELWELQGEGFATSQSSPNELELYTDKKLTIDQFDEIMDEIDEILDYNGYCIDTDYKQPSWLSGTQLLCVKSGPNGERDHFSIILRHTVCEAVPTGRMVMETKPDCSVFAV